MMTWEERMARVEENIRAGHCIREVCQIFQMGRANWYRRQNGFSSLAAEKTIRLNVPGRTIFNREGLEVDPKFVMDPIRTLVGEHPFWGYRRVHAYLKHRLGFRINRKRVYRLMKENGLLEKAKCYKPERTWRSKPQAERPNQFWGTDMTKFLIRDLGWVSLVIVEDWYPKKVLGWSAGVRGDTRLWLQALDEAIQSAFPQEGPRGQGVSLISDNGSQPTSRRYMAECKTLGIERIFTTYDNPKGNADTERLIRTLKEEAIWPYEFNTLEEAKQQIAKAIQFYNEQYCHSSLAYKSPNEFLREYFDQQEKMKQAA